MPYAVGFSGTVLVNNDRGEVRFRAPVLFAIRQKAFGVIFYGARILQKLFSQWHCGAEHRGRTAALKATAYETGDQLRDERNNRKFAYADHADGKGVIGVGVRVTGNAPLALRRDSFITPRGYDRRAHVQALLTSIASFEERQRQLHPGRNQTGHTDDRPIIGRSDVFDLDKSLVYDGSGNRRPDWQLNLTLRNRGRGAGEVHSPRHPRDFFHSRRAGRQRQFSCSRHELLSAIDARRMGAAEAAAFRQARMARLLGGWGEDPPQHSTALSVPPRPRCGATGKARHVAEGGAANQQKSY